MWQINFHAQKEVGLAAHIHFLLPPERAQMLACLSRMRLGYDYPYWLGGKFNWAAQSWLVLREYREGMTIGTEPVAGRINFGHVRTWRALDERRGEFRVSARADYPRLFDVDFEVLQNPSALTCKTGLYLPYWPTPGLIPRSEKRRDVRTVAYAGRQGRLNLAKELLSRSGGAFAGFEFRTIPPQHWHDLSGIDVLVAIRSFDRRLHRNKPPSKLFSAWRAGIPLVAGWDSAYSAIGVPGRDYVRVESESGLCAALRRLAEDPEFYDAMVQAGLRRAPEVSHEAVAQQWLAAFDGPIASAWERWSQSGPQPMRGAAARAADRLRAAGARAKSLVVDSRRPRK